MYSHHHKGVGASSKQVMMVEGQHVSRSQWLNLHSIVESNGIDPKILNIDGNLGMKVIYGGLVVAALKKLEGVDHV